MSMDILQLDPEALREVARSIKEYCAIQKDLIDGYLSQVSSLSGEWSDDETMGKLIEHISMLSNRVNSLMEQILSVYPSYFEERADYINSRPTI